MRNQFGGHAHAAPSAPPAATQALSRPARPVHVSHLSLHDFRSYPEAEVPLGPGRDRVRRAATGRARPTWSRRSATSPGSASHRVAARRPAGAVRRRPRRGPGRGGPGRARGGARGARSTRAGPTGPGSTGRRCPGPASCSAWCAPCCSPPRTWRWSRATRPSGGASSTTCWCSARPRFAGVRSDYDRVLKQRNSLLKTAGIARRQGRSGESALSTLGVWDSHLARTGAELLVRPADLVDDLRPLRRGKATRRWREGAGPRPTRR